MRFDILELTTRFAPFCSVRNQRHLESGNLDLTSFQLILKFFDFLSIVTFAQFNKINDVPLFAIPATWNELILCVSLTLTPVFFLSYRMIHYFRLSINLASTWDIVIAFARFRCYCILPLPLPSPANAPTHVPPYWSLKSKIFLTRFIDSNRFRGIKCSMQACPKLRGTEALNPCFDYYTKGTWP